MRAPAAAEHDDARLARAQVWREHVWIQAAQARVCAAEPGEALAAHLLLGFQERLAHVPAQMHADVLHGVRKLLLNELHGRALTQNLCEADARLPVLQAEARGEARRVCGGFEDLGDLLRGHHRATARLVADQRAQPTAATARGRGPRARSPVRCAREGASTGRKRGRRCDKRRHADQAQRERERARQRPAREACPCHRAREPAEGGDVGGTVRLAASYTSTRAKSLARQICEKCLRLDLKICNRFENM